MAAAAMRYPSLPTKAEAAQAQAASRQLERSLQSGWRLRLVTEDNRHEMIEIPPSALRLLEDLLKQLGRGKAVTIVPHGRELTTQEAADYLNVSRPYVVGLIEAGKLPAHKVGTHRRIAFGDLVHYDKEARRKSRAALADLADLDQQLGL